MTVDKEFEAFREMLMSQFARLAENAGRYVGRMSGKDREAVLSDALESAWAYSDLYDPKTQQLAAFWDFNLREAIHYQDFIVLRCLAGWETVPSEEFLKRVTAIGVPTDE